jgi:predicted signal transduction protein with EAL and GGDEF domain
VSLGGRSVLARASVGLVVLRPGDHVDTADHLLHRADVAMYEAKRSGKNRLVIADLTDLLRLDENAPGGPLELVRSPEALDDESLGRVTRR